MRNLSPIQRVTTDSPVHLLLQHTTLPYAALHTGQSENQDGAENVRNGHFETKNGVENVRNGHFENRPLSINNRELALKKNAGKSKQNPFISCL